MSEMTGANRRVMRRIGFFLLEAAAFAALLAIDLITKSAAVSALKGQAPIPIIDGVLELRYVQNTGAAFSLLENAQWLFVAVASIVLVCIVILMLRIPQTRHYLPLHVLLTLISAGAAGNLVDRITLNYVRDFIYIVLIDFPIFNVADMYVTVSTVLLMIYILFYYGDDDFSFLHRKASAS